jgi:hypothetical protein
MKSLNLAKSVVVVAKKTLAEVEILIEEVGLVVETRTVGSGIVRKGRPMEHLNAATMDQP